MKAKNKKQRIHYAWVVVMVCCLAIFSAGLVAMTIAVFQPAIAESTGMTITKVSLIFTVHSAAQVLTAPLQVSLYNKFKIRKALPAIMCCYAGALLLLSLTERLVVMLLAGVVTGFCTGALLNNLCTTVVKRWFRTGVEKVISVMITFFALGGTVGNVLMSSVITRFGWQNAYRCIAVFMLVIVLPMAAVLMKDGPADVGLELYENKHLAQGGGQKPRPVGGAGLTSGGAWKSVPFYFAAFFMAGMQMVVAFQQHLVSFAGNIGFAASVGAMAASVCSFTGIFSKISLGYVNEKIGVENSVIIYNSVGLMGLVMLLTMAGKSAGILCVSAALYGFYVQSTMVQSPTLTYRVFGESDDYNSIHGNIVFMSGVLTFYANTIVSAMYDRYGNYNRVIIMCMILNILTIVVANVLVRKNWRRKDDSSRISL